MQAYSVIGSRKRITRYTVEANHTPSGHSMTYSFDQLSRHLPPPSLDPRLLIHQTSLFAFGYVVMLILALPVKGMDAVIVATSFEAS